ncbi:hypothetical protein ACFWPK_28635 [Nocardia sp. NPDC058519]|uniref:hypothetical protein n=1 Tax=Nocardia sp. NPDC058519 TaxID=3346535 RepID=UPI00364B23FD
MVSPFELTIYCLGAAIRVLKRHLIVVDSGDGIRNNRGVAARQQRNQPRSACGESDQDPNIGGVGHRASGRGPKREATFDDPASPISAGVTVHSITDHGTKVTVEVARSVDGRRW